MHLLRLVALTAILLGMANLLPAQINRPITLDSVVQELVLRVDTSRYRYPADVVQVAGEPHLPFRYEQDAQTVEISLRLRDKPQWRDRQLRIDPSPDYDLLDSLYLIEGNQYRFRLRFRSLNRSDFLQLVLVLQAGERQDRVALRLFPFTETRAVFYPGQDELYIGEEKRFEIISNQVGNLRLDGTWQKQGALAYRFVERDGQAFIDLLPQFLGQDSFDFHLDTYRPFLDERGEISYRLPPIRAALQVRGSRLNFLRMDQREIIRERDNREGVEIQLDNHRFLQLHKTYRLEDREEKGGPLIAELHTVRHLSNDKVLAILRPYAYHAMQDGYLFVKDGDEARFITNVHILPEARITGIQILREGQSWAGDAVIRPGERLDIRVEGEGLSQARLYFEDLDILRMDTLTRNDKVASFTVEVPLDLRKRSLEIYNKGKKTGQALQVREFHRPRPLDFIRLDYGEGAKPLNELLQPVFFGHSLKDVVLSFDEEMIDRGGMLHGKQIVEVEIRITGTRNELIEMQRIESLEICPGESSPRHAFYGGACQREDISLNQFLFRKTHSLPEWSRVEIVVRHKKDRYGGEGFSQRVEIVLQRRATFDVEVSFPAGLMIKRVGVDGFPGLGGISLAMLAEFSFYHRNQMRRLKPYKLGAGFLAQNAFNFSPEVRDRDLGIVVLGSLYPIRRDKKLSFPLYGGFGYFINEKKFFYLLGPGIRVNF